jgi:hypothetical protein
MRRPRGKLGVLFPLNPSSVDGRDDRIHVFGAAKRVIALATEGWPDRVLPARSPRWLGGVASLGFGDERVCMPRGR